MDTLVFRITYLESCSIGLTPNGAGSQIGITAKTLTLWQQADGTLVSVIEDAEPQEMLK